MTYSEKKEVFKLIRKALREHGKISQAYLQRKLKITSAEAEKLIKEFFYKPKK